MAAHAASIPLDHHQSSFLDPNNISTTDNNTDNNTEKEKIVVVDKEERCYYSYKETYEKHKNIIQSLPQEKASWMGEDKTFVNYQGAWLSIPTLLSVMLVQHHYNPPPPPPPPPHLDETTTTTTTTTLLSTFPKAGTTWYKSLLFAILNRTIFPPSSHSHPLLSTPPHDLVPFLEQQQKQPSNVVSTNLIPPPPTSLSSVDQSCIFSTHIPYALLPTSVQHARSTGTAAGGGGCRIVYLFRNPKDVLTSSWHFFNKIRREQLSPLSLQHAFDLFTKGLAPYGPFWDHALGYWNAHLESPDKVLFLTYEETNKDPSASVKKMADFLGQPISEEEESMGVVEDILKLCNIENLRNLKVNNTGALNFSREIVIGNNDFYREGKVGDWEKHLTKEMIECLDQITMDKFSGAPGLIRYINSMYLTQLPLRASCIRV